MVLSVEEIMTPKWFESAVGRFESDAKANGRNDSLMEEGQIRRAQVVRLAARDNRGAKPRATAPSVPGIDEVAFHAVLITERRRAERSHKHFVLMLLEASASNGTELSILLQASSAIAASTRETDLIGWYRQGATLGVIFTELGEHNEALDTLKTKVQGVLLEHLGSERAARLTISVHLFPENSNVDRPGGLPDAKLYPELQPRALHKRLSLGIKRVIDIAGSAGILILASPFLGIIALLIKLTSRGPVLFKQERLGMLGRSFPCLKFRTMYTDCDSGIHQNYIHKFIAGKVDDHGSSKTATSVYKITSDPRVTPLGRFLRKTSLDELPQLWNVLHGEMSLVGPRPALRYEFEIYDLWHRRRVLEVTPGITGLWQVKGRSRTRFDEMVRLDLQYSRSWSLWLDLKILLATPLAIFSGHGAY